MKKKSIIFTGGGSGGHWFPLISMAESLLDKEKIKNNFELIYFGSFFDVQMAQIRQHFKKRYVFQTGKLRRYFSIQNFIDILKVGIGIVQCIYFLLLIKRKKVIFSSGGFVSIPVVFAGWLLKVPVIIHEQTSRVGLANRISGFMAKRIIISFESSRNLFKDDCELLGCPLRKSFYLSQSELVKKVDQCNEVFKVLKQYQKERVGQKKKILLIGGGAKGAKVINDFVEKNIDQLTKNYCIFHQLGKDMQSNNRMNLIQNYYSFSGLFSDDWIYLLKEIDIYFGRSGAGTVHEVNFLQKPAIFVPLKIAQKNEQYHNAQEAKESRTDKDSIVIVEESELENIDIIKTIKSLKKYSLNKHRKTDEITSNDLIYEVIADYL